MRKLFFFLLPFAMSAEIWQISSENFSQIQESKLPVVVEVHASWCNACKEMVPIFESAAEKYPDIQFAEISVDREKKLVRKLRISALPTFLFFKPGQEKPVAKITGVMTQEQFNRKIKETFKK